LRPQDTCRTAWRRQCVPAQAGPWHSSRGSAGQWKRGASHQDRALAAAGPRRTSSTVEGDPGAVVGDPGRDDEAEHADHCANGQREGAHDDERGEHRATGIPTTRPSCGYSPEALRIRFQRMKPPPLFAASYPLTGQYIRADEGRDAAPGNAGGIGSVG